MGIFYCIISLQADGCNSKIHSTASLYNFTTYANDIHGVEFSVIGNVKIIGFKVADNRDNGIEIQETNGEWEQATIEVRDYTFPYLFSCILIILWHLGYSDYISHFNQ